MYTLFKDSCCSILQLPSDNDGLLKRYAEAWGGIEKDYNLVENSVSVYFHVLSYLQNFYISVEEKSIIFMEWGSPPPCSWKVRRERTLTIPT